MIDEPFPELGPRRGGGGHVQEKVLDHGVAEAEGGRGEGVVDAGVHLGVVGRVGGGVEVQALVEFGADHLPVETQAKLFKVLNRTTEK